jgi:hypothetical protein
VTPALYLLTGIATGLLWAHRDAAAAAIWRAVDWLCGAPDNSPWCGCRDCVRRDSGERRW